MPKALLYSTAEATNLKTVDFDFLSEKFDPSVYKNVPNTEWSSALGTWVNADCWLIEKIKVFAVFFEDGLCVENRNGKPHVRWTASESQAECTLQIYNTIKNG